MKKVTFQCRCHNDLYIEAKSLLKVVREAQRRGWCASEEDLDHFFTAGELPGMACSIRCWINNEVANAKNVQASSWLSRFDKMLPTPPWTQYVGFP